MEDFYDPDLEARLYAEIHYTNDTYELPKVDPRREMSEGDAAPGSIRSYAKKTGMFPKKHRALIDGVRVPGSHRFQEPISGTGGRQDFRSNQSDSTRSIPPLFDFDRSNSSDPTRFNSPNPSRFNSPNPGRLNSQNPSRFNSPNPGRLNSPNPARYISPNPSRFNSSNPPRLNLLGPGRYNPPDFPRSNILDIRPNELDQSRVPALMYNRHPNYEMNPFASDEFNQRLMDPYFDHGQDFARFNQQDFIRLNRSTPNKSKGQVRKDTHMANLKKFSKKVRDQRRREKTKKNRKTGRRNIGPRNSSTPRKNPNRAARNPEVNKSIDGIDDVVNLDDSIEIIEIDESTDDNLAQSDLGSQTSNCQDKSNDNQDKSDENVDKSGNILGKSNENLDKSYENLDKSNHNIDKSNENLDKSSGNLDKSDNMELLNKNLDKSNENLDKSKNLVTPNKNLDKSNKNLDKSNKNLDKSKDAETLDKNLDKSNKNLDKSDHNLNKSKNVETPNKNLDKSNRNLDKSNKNLDKSKTLDKSSKSLEKSNKNLEKSDHNLDKSKNLETPNKNLDKSDHNHDESNDNLEGSNENNNLTDNQVNLIESSSETSDSQNSSAESSINNEKNDNNSKYNIKSPKNNSTKKLDSSSDSESESDESIFEVPVPPKPAPPLINLNDSDESDDSDSEEDSSDLISKDNIVQEEEEEDETEAETETDKEGFVTMDTWAADNSNSSKGENSSSSASKNSEKQIWDCDDDEDDDEKEEEEIEEEIIETNIVLNCSQVQKSVSTLEQLKNVGRESSNLISNDNMPESEEISITTDDNELNDSLMTLNVSENDSDKTSKSGSKNPGSEKKRSRDESKNRDDCLIPIKIPRNENESTSFEEYVSKPMPEPLKSFYLETRITKCMNDVRDIQSQMSRDPNRWAILDADLVRQRNDRRLRCSYCHQPGHKREKCPDKKKSATCYMCGTEGHNESRCPQKMCLTCGTKYSSYRKTCEYCRRLHCTLCKSAGHLKNNCPDLWRRYHDTTTPDAIIIPPEHQNVLKPHYQLSCCNCTRRGHDSSTCNRYRWSSHFPSPIFVTNYTDGPSYPPRIPTEQSIPQASSPLQNGTIYHYRSYKNSMHQNWSSDIIYPHEIPNITYTFETTEQERPVFLIRHFPVGSYPIDVHIKRIVPNKLQVELKTPTAQCTLELKKLMIQWMSRRSLDRKNITLTSRLPMTKAALLNALLTKLYKFIDSTSFKGLINYDEKFLSQKRSEALQAKVERIKKRGGKWKLDIPRILKEIEQRYLLELVSSLYNFNLAPSAEAILNDFLKLLELLSTDSAWEGDTGELSEVPQWIYMSCCWFNFELFTVHLSDYIVESKNMFLEHLNKLRERNMSKNRLHQELNLKMIITRAVQNKFTTDKSIEQILDKKKGKRVILENNRTQKSNSNKASKNNSTSSSKKNKNDQGKKPKENSLIIDGKINQEVLQREKLMCRAQAAVDMAKKHGLKSFIEQAEVMVKKIKDGGMIRKNAIEQLWTNMVKELRGNNISDQS